MEIKSRNISKPASVPNASSPARPPQAEPLSPWERGWGEGSVLARAAKLASQRSTDPRYSPFTASTTFSTVIPKCLNS